MTGAASSSPPDPGPDFAPVFLAEVELSDALPRLEAEISPSGTRYGGALCLVRLHDEPLGLVEVDVPADGLEPGRLALEIDTSLGEAIAAHLSADESEPARLSADGLGGSGQPRCRVDRANFLERAPFVSVVIPTRDRPQTAAKAVASVLACDYPEDRFEVILVDNRPEPGNDSVTAGSLADDRVRILHEPVSGGANARNTGLAEARGEIVAFTDDDVIADRDWLATIALAFDGAPGVGAASGLVAPLELETPAQVWFEGYARFSGRFLRRAYDLGDNRPDDDPLFPFDLGVLGTGANMAFRTEALREAGALDPAFNTKALPNGTDVEALLRVMLSGWTVVHDARAIVQHAHQSEYHQLERRVYGYGLGLTAVLTKSLLHHPSLIPELLRKLPRGIAFALSPSSPKNDSKSADFPAELNRLEIKGMMRGPWAYLRGRREAARARRDAKPADESKRGLRVLMVTDSYPPLVGGATFWSRQVAQEMSRRGHTVTLATSWQPETPAREDDGDVVVHRLRDLTSRVPWISADPYRHNPPPFPDPEAVVRLRRLIKSTRPDLIHSYGWLTHSVAAALVGIDVPLLVSTQDYGNICALRTLFRGDEICSGSAPLKCLRCAGSDYGAAKGTAAVAGMFGSRPLLRRKVTRIHSISRFVAAMIEQDLRPAAPITIVPNFAEDLSGAEVDEQVMAQLPPEPFILFVGALRRVKGLPELTEAYQRLDSPPPLVLAGPRAPDTPTGFPDGVTVLTSVPHPTVMAMWDRALIGVFPSRWPEPLGNVVYEAMSRGKAVIGTRPGGHEDMIDDDVSGLLVDAGDIDMLAEAMGRLIAEPGLRDRLGEQAAECSRRYTIGSVVPQLERLYVETAGSAAGTGTPGANMEA